jgi:hypothetical protein
MRGPGSVRVGRLVQLRSVSPWRGRLGRQPGARGFGAGAPALLSRARLPGAQPSASGQRAIARLPAVRWLRIGNGEGARQQSQEDEAKPNRYQFLEHICFPSPADPLNGAGRGRRSPLIVQPGRHRETRFPRAGELLWDSLLAVFQLVVPVRNRLRVHQASPTPHSWTSTSAASSATRCPA